MVAYVMHAHELGHSKDDARIPGQHSQGGEDEEEDQSRENENNKFCVPLQSQTCLNGGRRGRTRAMVSGPRLGASSS